MNVDDLRALRRAEPFKPFRLQLDDGRTLPVERAAFLAIAPTGTSVVYSSEDGGVEIIKTSSIVSARIDESLRHEWVLLK